MPAPTGSVAELLRFYDQRGYDRRIGFGRRPAVVVIDFSRAFTGGRSEFPGGDFSSEVGEALRLVTAGRDKAIPIVFTTIAYEDPKRDAGWWGAKVPWLEHCKAGSPLVEIDPALAPQAGETVLVKRYPSAFFETGLESVLARVSVDTLILAGCTTSVCVRATAIDAMQRGYRPIVAEEAVGDFNHDLHRVHLRDLHARYADVLAVDEILSHLGTLTQTPG